MKMIGAPNSLNLNCKVRVMKEAPGPSVSEEIADIFINYNIDSSIGSDNGLALVRRQAIIWANDSLITDAYMRHSAPMS